MQNQTGKTTTSSTATSSTAAQYARYLYADFMDKSKDPKYSIIKSSISKKKPKTPKKMICMCHCGRKFLKDPNNDFLSGDVCSRKCFESLEKCSCAQLLGVEGACFCGLKARLQASKINN